MTDPILMRGIERILIVIAAVVFAYMGYLLFDGGHKRGKALISVESGFMRATLSGTGPGLVFMGLGAFVLIYALAFGGARATQSQTTATQEQLDELAENTQILLSLKPQESAEISAIRSDLTQIQKTFRAMELNQIEERSSDDRDFQKQPSDASDPQAD